MTASVVYDTGLSVAHKATAQLSAQQPALGPALLHQHRPGLLRDRK
jgi:hypothetical protein